MRWPTACGDGRRSSKPRRRVSQSFRTALVGAVALLVVGELVARLQGDRLCSEQPGVIYERDDVLGWRHVPNLSGWLGACTDDGVPPTPARTDADGLVGQPRSAEKPPGTVRLLVLGGNAAEGFGVVEDESLARSLELRADQRRGARVEVLNGATGGWALDQSLIFFRRYGATRRPDVVILVLDPVADLATLSPGHLAALGKRVPAKPFFTLRDDGGLEPTPPFALAPLTAAAPAASGPLAWSQLYRQLRRLPPRAGQPMAWAMSGTFPHGTPDEERERSLALAGALLGTLRDEVAAAGGRLVAMIAPLPGASAPDAVGGVERERLAAVAEAAGVPVLDPTPVFASFERLGPLHQAGSVRLNGRGQALAAGELWNFLRDRALLPPGVVAARYPGSGRARPTLAMLPAAVRETLWSSRDWLVGRLLQFGLLAVCVVWLTAPLPVAMRDWVLAGLGLALLAVVGGSRAAAVGGGLGLAWYAAVELLPPQPATVLTAGLGVTLVAVCFGANTLVAPGESLVAPAFLAFASNVALLRLIAYAVDRRRGAPRLPLRRFLAGMLCFPTLPAGPIETPHAFAAARETTSGTPPSLRAALPALGRVGRGWLLFTLPFAFLVLDAVDVFTSRGDAVSRGRLWALAGELALFFTLLLAGWSDIAIGLGRLAGAPPPENMRRPWAALDVADFWRRWHATLSAWWRDYVYLPLGGERAATRNVLAVFLASALWHGWALSKTFGWMGFPPRAWQGVVISGLLNGAGVLGAQALARRLGRRAGPLGRPVRALGTWLFVALAWLPMLMLQTTSLADLGPSIYGSLDCAESSRRRLRRLGTRRY